MVAICFWFIIIRHFINSTPQPSVEEFFFYL
jgi:hypothetical protein